MGKSKDIKVLEGYSKRISRSSLELKIEALGFKERRLMSVSVQVTVVFVVLRLGFHVSLQEAEALGVEFLR